MQEIEKLIIDRLRSNDNIVISRHVRPDGDAVGSTLGLKRIIELSFPGKNVMVVNKDFSDYVAFLGKEDKSPEHFENYLGIVLDTATEDRISDPDILKCKEIIKIDHHIDEKPFGDISWVMEDSPSASEMIALLWYDNRDILKMDLEAATCLFTGIVTDTGRFKYSVTPKTLELASALLNFGIDTESLYAKLDLEDFDFYKFQAFVFDKMKISENGVAYLYVTREIQDRFHLSREQASESVDFMNAIKGSLIWMAFIDNPDKTIRVRIRSRYIAINKLANQFEGGGHANASGATVYDEDGINRLVEQADKLIADFKKTNKDVL